MIRDFQRQVIGEEGYVLTEGTLDPVAILCKVYDFLEEWGAVYDTESIRRAVGFQEDVGSAQHAYCYNTLLNPDKEEAEYIWQEEVASYLFSISPEGYCFGCSEGDGSCIGWFPAEREL